MSRNKHGLTFRHGRESQFGHVTAAGYLYDHPGMEGWRTFDHYGIAYVIEGEGRFQDGNGYDTQINPGDLIIVYPGLRHYYGPTKGRCWNEFYVLFDGDVFDLGVRSELFDPKRPVAHAEPIDYWARELELILEESGEPGYSSVATSCKLLATLARMLRQGPGGRVTSENARWLQHATRLLEYDLENPPNVEAIAEALETSVPTFRKRFKELSGQPPGRFRMTRLIERASELMQDARLTNKEIAEQLGFRDEFYFSRRFKEITGKAPREFRRSLFRQS